MVDIDFEKFVCLSLFCQSRYLYVSVHAAHSRVLAFESFLSLDILCRCLPSCELSNQCYFGTTMYAIHYSHPVVGSGPLRFMDSGALSTAASESDGRPARGGIPDVF